MGLQKEWALRDAEESVSDVLQGGPRKHSEVQLQAWTCLLSSGFPHLWDEGGSVTGPTEAGQFPGRGDCTVPLGPVLRRAPCVVPCSAVTTWQFLIFEQGASYFHFTPWSHKFCSQCCPEDQHRPVSKGGGHGGDQGLLLACRRPDTTCPEVWREGAGAEMGVCSCSQNAPPPPKPAGWASVCRARSWEPCLHLSLACAPVLSLLCKQEGSGCAGPGSKLTPPPRSWKTEGLP